MEKIGEAANNVHQTCLSTESHLQQWKHEIINTNSSQYKELHNKIDAYQNEIKNEISKLTKAIIANNAAINNKESNIHNNSFATPPPATTLHSITVSDTVELNNTNSVDNVNTLLSKSQKQIDSANTFLASYDGSLSKLTLASLFQNWFKRELHYATPLPNTKNADILSRMAKLVCYLKCFLPTGTVINPKPDATNITLLYEWINNIESNSLIVQESAIEFCNLSKKTKPVIAYASTYVKLFPKFKLKDFPKPIVKDNATNKKNCLVINLFHQNKM